MILPSTLVWTPRILLPSTFDASHSSSLLLLFPFLHESSSHTSLATTRFAPNTATMDLIRSVVQPVTHNLPEPLRNFAVSLIGPSCYSTLLLDVDLASQECVKLAISKGLGIGIIAASSVVKVPQILKLYNSKSAEGLSFLSYLLETVAYIIGLAYNVRSGFPFSTFGETVFIVVQNVAITFMILQYSGKYGMALGFVGALQAVVPALFMKDLVPMEILSYLQAGAGVLGVASKVPQIITVFSEGTTGQLSAFAVSSILCHNLECHHINTLCFRYSTTLPAPSRASSQPSRKSMTSLSSTALSLALPLTLFSLSRWSTTGTRPRPRQRASARRHLSRLSSRAPPRLRRPPRRARLLVAGAEPKCFNMLCLTSYILLRS